MSNDLQRVKEFDDGTLSRVGVGLLSTAGLIALWVELVLDAERHDAAALFGAAFRGLLLYWAVAYGLRLLSLERNPRKGKLDFRWRLNPYGIAARHPMEAPQRYHLFLRVLTIGVASHFLINPNSPFWRPALALLVILDVAHLVTAESAHAAYKARAKTQALGDVNLKQWEKYYDASKLVFPGARIGLSLLLLYSMSDPVFSPSDDWVENLRLTVAAAAALLTTHYTLQNVWLYSTRMHRSLGELRTLLARGQISAGQAQAEYLNIYSNERLSKELQERLPALRFDYNKKRE